MTSSRRGKTPTCRVAGLLLDTHALLWFDTAPERLPDGVVTRLRDRSHSVYVSAVSAWELSIKNRLGKLPEADALLTTYADTLRTYGFAELPFTGVHALRDRELGLAHPDPFDRALVAQALVEGLHLVSRDPAVAAFPGVTIVWND